MYDALLPLMKSGLVTKMALSDPRSPGFEITDIGRHSDKILYTEFEITDIVSISPKISYTG